jgi:hypothetical protein
MTQVCSAAPPKATHRRSEQHASIQTEAARKYREAIVDALALRHDLVEPDAVAILNRHHSTLPWCGERCD